MKRLCLLKLYLHFTFQLINAKRSLIHFYIWAKSINEVTEFATYGRQKYLQHNSYLSGCSLDVDEENGFSLVT